MSFLRRVEHRLQMVADEQTQRLPFEREALARFAKFCGYARLDGFRRRPHPSPDPGRAALCAAVRGRAGAQRRLGQISSSPASPTIPRRWPPCGALGFQRPEAAAETVRGWHFGRRAAVRSARAREVLTELTPALSKPSPDRATRTPRFPPSTKRWRACPPASSSCRSCARTPLCANCSATCSAALRGSRR